MSGIFGYISPQPDSTARAKADVMEQAMLGWGPDGGGIWHDERCSLGQRLLFNTPEAVHERLPRWVDAARLAITAEARIDNRDELCDHFAIPHPERPTTPDSDLILRAYLKWGEECPDHLLGDWSFAIWHPDERKLFLARDHQGNTGLVYWQQDGNFAFASTAKALHAIGAPRRLNELYLAQLLISWPAYHGPQTIDLDIHHLPPAHAMSVTPDDVRIWRYWRLEDTPELRLPSRDDYVQGLLEVYDRAVKCRLRSYRPVGVTLSGGLDSGSVTALAARELAKQGKRLTAFTAVPRFDTSQSVGPNRFGDETEYAAATAAFCGNVDHVLLDSAHISPIAGIRRTLDILSTPSHAASNFFWIIDILETAQKQGLGTLLTGQGGNATVSWRGAPELRSRWAAFRHGGLKEGLRRTLPLWAMRPVLRMRAHRQTWEHSAIHADFARRLQLAERRVEAMGCDLTLRQSWRSPRDIRYAAIKPGAVNVGGLWAEMGAEFNLEVRDPTRDKRVLVYTIAVPDVIFDTPDGMSNTPDRWLIRAAMAGLMPDSTRLNTGIGIQSADLLDRLTKSRQEVTSNVESVNAAPALDFVDLGKMRQAWKNAQGEPTALNNHRASSILLRGLMTGLFLNY